MTERYADVIIDIAHEKVDKVFQYRIPQELAQAVYPGVQVLVPFGRGNRQKAGYVVELSEETVRKRVEKVSSIERIKSNVDKEVGDAIRAYQAGLEA